MKRIFIVSIALLAGLSVLASPETGKCATAGTAADSADSMVISHSSSSSSSQMTYSEGQMHLDFDIPFYDKIKNKHRDSIDPGSLGLGMIWTDSNKPFDFNPSSSLEVFMYATDTFWHSGAHSFSSGPGIGWKNFTLTGSTAMSKNSLNEIVAGPYPEGASPKLSRLRVFSFSFPILYSCNISRGFGFTIGPVINLNTGSVINTKYQMNGEKQKDKYKKVHCNVATVDLMFQVNLKEVSFYVKYSPMNLMDKAYWPEFHQQCSFGIAL